MGGGGEDGFRSLCSLTQPGTQQTAQGSLKLTTILPQLPQFWNYRHKLPHLVVPFPVIMEICGTFQFSSSDQ